SFMARARAVCRRLSVARSAARDGDGDLERPEQAPLARTAADLAEREAPGAELDERAIRVADLAAGGPRVRRDHGGDREAGVAGAREGEIGGRVAAADGGR